MKENSLNRRRFFAILGAGSAALAAKPLSVLGSTSPVMADKPATNITDAAKAARTEWSMPGKFPGKVVLVKNVKAVVNNEPVEREAYLMIEKAMLELTGKSDLGEAWRTFVSPGERIGLKVNPVAGKLLSTSHAVTQSVIRQLEASGIERKNIIIWDRRDMELKDVGFTKENYPGITIRGTECQDDKGSFFDSDGKLYGERNIDKEWYYWADVEGEYDNETMPYMVNGGKY